MLLRLNRSAAAHGFPFQILSRRHTHLQNYFLLPSSSCPKTSKSFATMHNSRGFLVCLILTFIFFNAVVASPDPLITPKPRAPTKAQLQRRQDDTGPNVYGYINGDVSKGYSHHDCRCLTYRIIRFSSWLRCWVPMVICKRSRCMLQRSKLHKCCCHMCRQEWRT